MEDAYEGKTEGSRHTNKVWEKGTLLSLEKGASNTGIPYLNLLLEVKGKKYTENIPCVAYGHLADEIEKQAKTGDTVSIYGRLRSKTKEGNKVSITFICEQFDKVIA